MKAHCLLVLMLLLGGVIFSRYEASPKSAGPSLCNNGETVVFNCSLKGSNKIVSLCSSAKLTKTEGYLQYRFGLPNKIELEYPKDHADSQKSFRYSHYLRAQVDLTEISFASGGYTYTVFDSYNGEEKPSISEQGVNVTSTDGKKDVSLNCRGRAQAKLGNLTDVLENVSEP